ncbi:MAG: RNA 2',3'-cyclic phosphodiesterase [Candidatus Acidiferrum sp.]
MRLFIAIEISTEIRSALSAFLKELRGIAPHAKWVRTENLHVTLKFLGETEPAKISAIESALGSIRSMQPVTLEFRGLGFFPNEKRPRVFWVGMESSSNLQAFADEIDRSMHEMGFPLEDRPFTPHLTLARFSPPGLPPKLGSAATDQSSRNFGAFTAREFHLIESKLKSTGAEYTTVQSFPFVTET